MYLHCFGMNMVTQQQYQKEQINAKLLTKQDTSRDGNRSSLLPHPSTGDVFSCVSFQWQHRILSRADSSRPPPPVDTLRGDLLHVGDLSSRQWSFFTSRSWASLSLSTAWQRLSSFSFLGFFPLEYVQTIVIVNVNAITWISILRGVCCKLQFLSTQKRSPDALYSPASQPFIDTPVFLVAGYAWQVLGVVWTLNSRVLRSSSSSRGFLLVASCVVSTMRV